MSKLFQGRSAKTETRYYDSDVSIYRRRRTRSDWAGVGLGDAFKANLDYFVRIAAQRLFYAGCRKIQVAAANLAGVAAESNFQPKVKPQLTPCYTSYPAVLAAYAAVGLTGYLEFEGRVTERILSVHLSEYLKDPAAHDHVSCDPAVYRKIAEKVTRTVQTRLLLADLARQQAMALVEIYRLFAASQQSTKFTCLPEIINAVILYGDIFPDWRTQSLHPLTRDVLGDLDATSRPFFDQLDTAAPQDLALVGVAWVRAACACLAKYLPPPGEEAQGLGGPRPAGAPPEQNRFGQDREGPPPTDRIAPLNGPNPPSLFGPPSAAEQIARDLLGNPPKPGPPGPEGPQGIPPETARTMQALEAFRTAVDKASGQQAQWEDMRSDLAEQALRSTDFREGPIQGSPTDGHEVKLRLGSDEVAGGEIYDRPVEISDDLVAYEKLASQAQPATDALRRTLYPNIEQMPETQRLRTSGSLDPARLAMADFSPVVFKRHRIEERADRRGRPVLLLACDGSGSLDRNQMQMLKILAAAWLNSTVKTRVQVLAALYHSGGVRNGVAGPLVQWIYHPRKTPVTNRREAARALISLPDTGTGVQSDALSIAFLLDEARHLARGRMVYLILLSDCQWNRSFNTPKSGRDEVLALFEAANEEFEGKLHTTLVALGVDGETGFETLLQKVITVPAARLADYAAVAEQIGVYVASCIRERHRFVAGR